MPETSLADLGARLMPEGRRLSDLLMTESLLPAQPQPIDPVTRATLGGDPWRGVVTPIGQDTSLSPANMAIGLIGGPALKGIRAYHGSPHKFDKFDITRIGEGQGAQSYGHGLYFAENPATAQHYRDTLAGQPELLRLKVGSVSVGPHNNFDYSRRASQNTMENIRASLIEDVLIDEAALRGAPNKQAFVLQKLDEKIADYKTSWPEGLGAAASLRRILERPGAVDLKIGPQPGAMYEVNIRANPEQFLDWDRPLSGQPQPVQGALERFGLKAQPEQMRAFDDALLAALQGKGPATLPPQPRNPEGPSIYDRVGMQSGMIGQDQSRYASSALRDAGIPGIKYLDQGSRYHPSALPNNPINNEAKKFLEMAGGDTQAAGRLFYESNPVERWGQIERDEISRVIQAASSNRPTSNFVLFDDSIIDILKRYGLIGGAAAGGALASPEAQAQEEWNAAKARLSVSNRQREKSKAQ